jgi:GNAT superfamily N-acetyltransferase
MAAASARATKKLATCAGSRAMTLRNLRAATLMSIVTGGGLSRQFLREQAQKIKGKTQREGIDGCPSGAHAKPGQLAEALWQRKPFPRGKAWTCGRTGCLCGWTLCNGGWEFNVSRDWKIRRVRGDEGPRLRELRLRALAREPKAFGSTFEREEKFGPEVWDERANAAAAGLASLTVVAEHADRWVGMATGLAGHAEEHTPGPLLVGMFVDAGMRRRGIGDALVTSVKDWARSGGHNALNLWVVSLNAPAMALYRRCGFLPSGRARPLAHTPDLMELHMLVELAQT